MGLHFIRLVQVKVWSRIPDNRQTEVNQRTQARGDSERFEARGDGEV